MTSKLTRERLQEIAEDGFLQHGESKVLARMALAAMDCEPVAWMAIYHGEIYDDAIGITRSVVEAQADRFGWESALTEIIPLYPHAQQPAAVVLEEMTADGIIDMHECGYVEGWNACRAAMLQAGNSPVIPDGYVMDALQKVARIRLDMNDFDGDRRGIADCLGDAEEALIEVVNRRAAMFAAAPQDEAKKDKPHNNFGTGARLTNHRFKV